MSGWKTAVLLFLIAVGLSVLVGCVHGQENDTVNTTNESYVIVEIPTPDSLYNITQFPARNTYRITQGQDVYINDTIDVSGMGWGTGFAWYGTYGEYDYPVYIREFKNYHYDLFNFYIDPATFSSRPGMWYQYYGNNSEPNGNLAAFDVHGQYRNTTVTYPNGTVVNASQLITKQIPQIVPQPTILPEIREGDYLLAIGDPMIVNTGGPAQVWIFGRVDSTYGSTTNGNMTFSGNEFVDFEPGTYTMLIQKPGKNTDFDVREYNGTLQYRDGWNGVKTADTTAMSPTLALDQLEHLLANTDDEYQTYTLVMQQPTLTIERMDEVWLESKAKDFPTDSGDITFMDVRGYTNLRNETNISVVLDKDYITNHQIGRWTTYAETHKSAVGNRTMFEAWVPVFWDTMPTGLHMITANGAYGSYVNAQFPIEILPADSFRPNATIKYAGDENPWKPNLTVPTPVIIVKTVPGPVVTVTVTPSNEQVKAQQDAIASEHEGYWARVIVMGVVGLITLGYLYWVIRRWRRP